ncbi:MAG: LPS export ABC transporter periplasmic protein LptC [bacterium]
MTILFAACKAFPRAVRFLFLISIAILIAATASLSSETALASENASLAEIEEFLSITADSTEHNEANNTARLSGNVQITLKHFSLETEELTIDMSAGIIKSEGDLFITTNNLRFHGKSLEYDYENKTGSIKSGEISIDGFNLSSEEILIQPEIIIMSGVVGTTCPLDCQDYHIYAKTLELSQDGKARLKDISFYYRKRKIISWPSYGMRLGSDKSKTASNEKSVSTGAWAFSPPAMGYSKFGGLELRSGVRRVRGRSSIGLNGDYFLREGMFTEALWQKAGRRGVPQISLRLGKQYKENRGYFRNTSPQRVWNQPSLEVIFPKQNLRKTRFYLGSDIEIGRMKEANTKKALSRFYTKVDSSYPINPGDKVLFSLIGDARFAAYESWQKYKVLGLGAGAETGDRNSRFLSVQYMYFKHSGSTPFLSDLVNTNDKLFLYGSTLISPRTQLFADAQYDINLKRTDEVIYGAERRYKCIKFRFALHSKSRQVGLNMEILNPGRK